MLSFKIVPIISKTPSPGVSDRRNHGRLLTAAVVSSALRTRHSNPSKQRMDRNLKLHFISCIIFFISVSTLTESRLAHSQGTNPHHPSTTHGNFQAHRFSAIPQQDARPRTVVVHCYPDSMEVVVQADMFDTGLQVEGSHLYLGSDSKRHGGSCGAEPSAEAQFTLRSRLMDCGTRLSSTAENIVYSNILVYAPEPSHDGLLRLDGAAIPVECYYEKKYAVGGIPLQPTWVPFVSRASAKDQIDFSLMLMTDDWRFERGSHSYFLGDPMHFQVSAILRKHAPLRVYIDHCVATSTPDVQATLRYDFIEHHGCLSDASMTNSKSHFLPRDEEHKLRFQLHAFRFAYNSSSQIYITCYVKAVPVGAAVRSKNRACSFINNSWRSVDGNHQACKSCDSPHLLEEPPSTEPPKTTTRAITQPYMTPRKSLVQNKQEHPLATFFRVRPGSQQSRLSKAQHSPAGLMKRGAEYKAAQTVQMGPITVLQTSETGTRPTDSKTSL